MERLSGMDASFLYAETPTGHTHVTGVIVIDAAKMTGGYQFDRVVEMIQQRLHRLKPFRRRLVEVPLSFDHPVWIEDPDFDITNHMHRVTWPAPGRTQELAALVGDLMSRPLDRQRPLWEMWVAEGGKEGRVALISKIHHSRHRRRHRGRPPEPALRPGARGSPGRTSRRTMGSPSPSRPRPSCSSMPSPPASGTRGGPPGPPAARSTRWPAS